MEKKEAMKILKDFHDKSALFSVRTALHTIIPELKESEDEKIRRNIIAALKGEGYYDCDLTNECIAWLEKQGEQKTSVVDFKAKDWYVSKVDGKIYNAKFMEKTPTNQARKLEIEKAAMSATGIIKQEEWFIKGAEWSDKNPSYICSEKQNEQKPTDKIEPKFHEGEWIVWKDKCYKVNYNGCGYELVDQNGLSTSLEYGTVDKSAHLWTIQDAKDGDVLQLGVVTVIFQEYIGNGNCKCYYSVCNGEFEIPTKDESYGTFNATPATKEQRDLLFSKMRESGYEFDFEKKELKKLSQRMISAEAKEALYDKPTDEEMKELLRTEYEKGRADTIAEMKSSWSEEDEHLSYWTIHNLTELKNRFGENYGDSGKCIDWIKQLKQRIGG